MWFPQDLPVAERPADNAEVTVTPEWTVADWIVMSASCDVDRETKSYPHVLLGHVLPVSTENFGVKTEKERDERAEVVRKG
jgi:hypothetical protein